MIRRLAIVAVAVAAIAIPAHAHKNFPPFVNLLLKADLATEQGKEAWLQQIGQANVAGLVYLDWHLQNFTKSEVFKSLVPPNGGDDEACDALAGKSGKLSFVGGAVPDNNNALVRMNFDLDRLPAFTMLACEAVIGTGASGLRIRGFFYAADHRIEVAQETSLTPLAVEPSRLPAGFFAH